jgi:putative transposase
VSGLARTRLSKSVADAGWSMLVRLLEEKALRCHRTGVRVSVWFPSSRLCSGCGFNSGKKTLAVRSWTCPQCGIGHDRDLNAARNILVEGRMVAAGMSQRLPVKREPTKVPRERHGRNPGHSWPGGCQRVSRLPPAARRGERP